MVEPVRAYVLGSDVVYSEGAVNDLLETLPNLGPQTTIILADAILEYFLDAAFRNFIVGRIDQVGLAVAQGAKLRGASRIIGVDINPGKAEQAKKFGVDEYLNPKDLDEPISQPEITAHYGLLLTGRTLKGTMFGGWKPKSDIPLLVDRCLKKEIQVDEFVTHEVQFEEINKAFDLMKGGECLR
ncbi:hypothetical protein MLD38_032885 [Melastoma candidum]|uniref:Uncharacterized protein n=1 Tax=Melastoma candidum TaxID=119954 RepID=A0ACB9M722_9MYRT|nr:hypothetical protein MLD38_032885 [Melastoma candidum]